ncbi:hypothetical protein J2N86_09085 [Legionella lytica]|uniref:Transmembrane protein n=1 Tax=Legionella lytica TaxID=96232 RepID=A0ABY4Y5G1_9GAMM|nr:hypothetical protein [Legionella lytica]USQ12858.1 hypothetical protein J2N86_09085 [Legionella lytica]
MEQNRFGGHDKLFIFGMICLTTSLGLFFFSLYILPYFLFEWSYNIPDFILDLMAKYQDDYQYTSAGSKTVIWLMFFIPCLITGIISYYISRYFDNQMYGPEINPEEEQDKQPGELQKQIKESASLGGKILALMIVIVVLIFLLQYVIQSTS